MAKKETSKKVKAVEAPPIAPSEIEFRCDAISVLSVVVRSGKLIVIGTRGDGTKINQTIALNGRDSVDLVIS